MLRCGSWVEGQRWRTYARPRGYTATGNFLASGLHGCPAQLIQQGDSLILTSGEGSTSSIIKRAMADDEKIYNVSATIP